MNCWRGNMDWPLKEGWVCEICGKNSGLEWGMVHAQCRCSKCHTQYRMRDDKNEVVEIPICQLKPEYYIAFKKLWDKNHKFIEDITNEEWDGELKGVK